MQIQRNSPQEEKKKISDAVDGRRSAKAQLIPVVRRSRILKEHSPREKVIKTLSLYMTVYEALEHDRAVNPGKANTPMVRLNHEARVVVLNSEKQVNDEKRIAAVPGIEVGDRFQFKVELNLIGLHFDMMSGIDWMYKDGLILATSVVSSEGSGYDDRFNPNAITYCGVLTKLGEDPMAKRSNVAMLNSMRRKDPIRVIRGQKKRVKKYVYKGLYLVNDYWQEELPSGYVCFKFKLLSN